MIDRYRSAFLQLKALRPDAVAEYRFHPVRRWRADFCLPSDKVIIEIDGGVFTGGRHTRGLGFIADQEKTNAAAILGYRVLRFVPRDIKSGNFINTVRALLDGNTTPESK